MFHNAEWNLYYYQPEDTHLDLKVGGYFKQFSSFHYMVVHSAGHVVPETQLAMTTQML